MIAPALVPPDGSHSKAAAVAQVDYLALVFSFVAAAQRAAGCELAAPLPEEAAAALSVLQSSETHITALLEGGDAAIGTNSYDPWPKSLDI